MFSTVLLPLLSPASKHSLCILHELSILYFLRLRLIPVFSSHASLKTGISPVSLYCLHNCQNSSLAYLLHDCDRFAGLSTIYFPYDPLDLSLTRAFPYSSICSGHSRTNGKMRFLRRLNLCYSSGACAFMILCAFIQNQNYKVLSVPPTPI